VSSQLLSDHDYGLIYTGTFFLSICLIAALEAFFPRRKLTQPMGLRWASHAALSAINISLIRSVFPLAQIAVAVYATRAGIGLLNGLDLGPLVSAILAIILLDLWAWTVHYLTHRVPLLWRLHSVHHSDPDYDFSTGLRFHPLEALTTFGLQSIVILLLGPPAIAVFVYKLMTAFMSSFVHANLKLPPGLDRNLRKILVTPDLHRIHHSSTLTETNSNFAGITPFWDRLFGTCIDQPAAGHEALDLGLRGLQSIESIQLRAVLAQPFRATASIDSLRSDTTSGATA
jgi:sterol desaturase/sphingolipid hydroxylase (fatty acid hydroxylase superfamily)